MTSLSLILYKSITVLVLVANKARAKSIYAFDVLLSSVFIEIERENTSCIYLDRVSFVELLATINLYLTTGINDDKNDLTKLQRTLT